jgi:putative ABC transport system ATP-binding protein
MAADQHPKDAIVQIQSVSKRYQLGSVPVLALVDASASIRPNRFTVISGPSGSGKSTLLNLIGSLDVPDSGHIRVGAHDLSSLTDDQRSEFRARRIGFVFQSFNLISVLSALENVEYPLRLTQSSKAQSRARATELLAAVGLADKGHHLPSQLSGGQRQRVAIARALVNQPALVLADEPTANLDRATGAEIIALMRRMQRDTGTTFVFSSHDPALMDVADDRIHIVDGRVTSAETASETLP